MIRSVLAPLFVAAALMAAADNTPKYIFYYIGDGMGLAPANAAQVYMRDVRGSSDLLLMNTFPQVGWLTTYSAVQPVTDSAAAGTALATGSKTKNGMLGMNADTVAVTSIAEELFAKGWGVGLTTSVYPDDATPGAFYAHVPSRKLFYDIDCQMAACGYQFIGGAGLKGDVKDGIPTDIYERLGRAGVQVVRGPEAIATINADRVLLLNPEGTKNWNIGYTIDSIPGVLTLPVMAKACLEQLKRTSPDRFFMMVEGGNIDHALHASDGGAAVKEIINFNEALQVAVDFYNAHPSETLIIVTADHDTGGSALLGQARTGLKYIDCQKISKEEFNDYCKNLLVTNSDYSWEQMKTLLSEKLGLFDAVPVSADEEKALQQMFDRTFRLRNTIDQETLYANFNTFAVEVFKIFNRAAGFAFTTTSHSANPVPVYAMGCGAELFCGYTDNINIPQRLRRLTAE